LERNNANPSSNEGYLKTARSPIAEKARVSRLKELLLMSDSDIRANLRATMNEFELFDNAAKAAGYFGTITETLRDPNSKPPEGSRVSDHYKGLAVDVSYSTYAKTKEVFAMFADLASKRGTVRQLIFENVRTTPMGYHIHIGFYPPVDGVIEEKSGPVTLLTFSKKNKPVKPPYYPVLQSATDVREIGYYE